MVSPPSQTTRLRLTEPESPLQISGRMGMRFYPLSSLESRAASLFEDGLPGLEKWLDHKPPAIVAPRVLTQQLLWVMKMTEEMKFCFCAKRLGCQATYVG